MNVARKPKVNILGVNGLGAVAGLHPAVGAAASAGIGSGLAFAMRRSAKTAADKRFKYSELIGGGAALGVSGLMMVSPKTRGAGVTGVVVALLNNGIRFLEQQTVKAGDTAGFGIVSPQQVPTLGAMSAYHTPALGAMSAQQVPSLGEVTVDNRQLAGNGGLPTFQGIGSAYGATCMG
jgi:hypothetical protein